MKKSNKQIKKCNPENDEAQCCYEKLRETFNFGTLFTICLFFGVFFVGTYSTFDKVSSVLRYLEGQALDNIADSAVQNVDTTLEKDTYCAEYSNNKQSLLPPKNNKANINSNDDRRRQFKIFHSSLTTHQKEIKTQIDTNVSKMEEF